jgi:hypothetical protein
VKSSHQQFAYTHDTQALAFAYIDTTKTLVLAEQYATIVEMTTTDDDEKEKEGRSFMFCLTSCIINIEEKHLSVHLTDEVKRKRDDGCFITIFFSSFTVFNVWMHDDAGQMFANFLSILYRDCCFYSSQIRSWFKERKRKLVCCRWTSSKGMLFILISRRLQVVLWTGVESKIRAVPDF